MAYAGHQQKRYEDRRIWRQHLGVGMHGKAFGEGWTLPRVASLSGGQGVGRHLSLLHLIFLDIRRPHHSFRVRGPLCCVFRCLHSSESVETLFLNGSGKLPTSCLHLVIPLPQTTISTTTNPFKNWCGIHSQSGLEDMIWS